jgi:hypothetical protein
MASEPFPILTPTISGIECLTTGSYLEGMLARLGLIAYRDKAWSRPRRILSVQTAHKLSPCTLNFDRKVVSSTVLRKTGPSTNEARTYVMWGCHSDEGLYVMLSCVGRGLYDGLITRPEESYRVSVCV